MARRWPRSTAAIAPAPMRRGSDLELFAWRALALGRSPRPGRHAAVHHGFDDFTPLARRAETIAVRCGADVTSLPFEPGREGSARGGDSRELARGAREQALAPVDEHYASESRDALHLERLLFEEPGTACRPRFGDLPPLGRRRTRRGRAGGRAGPRAAPRRRAARRRGVVCSATGRYASLVEQVCSYGSPIPSTARCLRPHRNRPWPARPDPLCRWREAPRTCSPAHSRCSGSRDWPTAWRRRCKQGAHAAEQAWALGGERWPLDELDRLRQAQDAAAFVAELEDRLVKLVRGPQRRHVLSGPSWTRPARCARGRPHSPSCAGLGPDGARPDAARVHRVLEQLQVHLGDTPQPDRGGRFARVHPGAALRGRACACRGEPRGAPSEPFLSDDDRRRNLASGLMLPVREDRLDRERYLFYVCASRAERLLVLSSRSSDEDNPEAESFFVDDVRELFTSPPELRDRSLADVTWSPSRHPPPRSGTGAGRRRTFARPLPARSRVPRCRGPARLRDAVSAAALERFADCPVKWLVESVLDPEKLAPDSEQRCAGGTRTRCSSTPSSGYARRPAPCEPHEPGPRRAHPARGAPRAQSRLPAAQASAA